MKKHLNTLLLSIGAGICIGIGSIVFLSCDNKAVGAVFFAVGLYIICVQGLNLYTGKIGYLVGSDVKTYLPFLGEVWLGNLIGTYLTGIAVRATRVSAIAKKAQSLCETKNGDSMTSLFFLAIGCGILMYAAVDSYKKCQNPLILIFCVAVFILCGFEHCIADMAYYSIAGMWSGDALIRILVISLGNSVGGVLVPILCFLKE